MHTHTDTPLNPNIRRLPESALPEHYLDCPECGLRVHIPELVEGRRAACPRCRHSLVRVAENPYLSPLAYASAALIFMLFVYSMDLVSISMSGVFSPLSLPEMMKQLILQDFGFLAEVIFLFTFGTPIVFVLLCLYLYTSFLLERPLPFLLAAARTYARVRNWIMLDVFFISFLVAYIKLKAISTVHFETAFWLLGVLALLIVRTSVSTPEHWIYSQIARLTHRHAYRPASDNICCSRCLFYSPADRSRCPICRSPLFNRRPGSLQAASAFLIAAAILYLPANLLPIMISANPAQTEISTIMSGIVLMWQDGDKLVAAIIFSASIMVPTLKIVSLAVLIISAKIGLPMLPEKMSVMYRITEWVGRWSMIDIFVITILMSAFHTPLARVTPGPAAVYFCLVVLLTMLSAHYFDPRLLWDRANTQH